MKNHPQPPKGLARFFYRLPILFYRIGLGALLGERFLLLEHVGRKSGMWRKAVLEIIRHGREKGVYYVVSAFGDRSDWYRNILHTPDVMITVAGRRMRAHAAPLSPAESVEEILDYARRHPKAFEYLTTKLLGYSRPETESEMIEVAQNFIVVEIQLVGDVE